MIRDILFLKEECDIAVTDRKIDMIPPVTNKHVEQTYSKSIGGDAYNGRLCLLCPDSVEDLQELRDGYVDSQGLNHWHTLSWDPGTADSRVLSVCYDCLCLMALFRAVIYLARDWVEVFVWTGHDEVCCRSTGWELQYLPWIYPPGVVDRLGGYLTEIKVPGLGLVLSEDKDHIARRCACMCRTPLGVFSVGRISLRLIGCRACVGGLVNCSDWLRMDCVIDFLPGGVWINYIRPGLEDVSLIVAAPVTGSLVSSALFVCLSVHCTAGFSSYWTFCGTDCVLLTGSQLFLRRVSECWTVATNSAAVVEDRAGITFGVELYVPWDAPEAVVDISSAGVVPLRHIPEGASESRVLQGRDVRSVRVLVPDCRDVDQHFHDVTIVDMGDVPESHISLLELSTLSQQWPPAVISCMGLRQQELEEIRAAAKKRFRQSRPSCCMYCGVLIKCDMYRHVARFHLDLAQLWRCRVSWCTVWKGMPQDCMDHIRGAHDVPWEIKSASLEKYLPSWTVTRKVWSDSLAA